LGKTQLPVPEAQAVAEQPGSPPHEDTPQQNLFPVGPRQAPEWHSALAVQDAPAFFKHTLPVGLEVHVYPEIQSLPPRAQVAVQELPLQVAISGPQAVLPVTQAPVPSQLMAAVV
jgi:hypothetical protein